MSGSRQAVPPDLRAVYERLAVEFAGLLALTDLTPIEARTVLEPIAERHAAVPVEGVTTREDVLSDGTRCLVHESHERLTDRTIVHLHGGGWVVLSPLTHARACALIARAAKARVIAPFYPLAPEHPFPEPLDAVRRAIAAIAQAEGRPVTVTGDSAGANLALAAALKAPEHVDRLGLIYGVFDDDHTTASHREKGDGSHPLTSVEMAWFWQHYAPREDHPGGRPWQAKPLHGPLERLTGPVHIAAVEHDCLRDDSVRLHRALSAAGVPSTLHEWVGLYHGCLLHDRFAPTAADRLDAFAKGLMRSPFAA